MIFSVPQNTTEWDFKKNSADNTASKTLDLFAISDNRLNAKKSLLINAVNSEGKDEEEDELIHLDSTYFSMNNDGKGKSKIPENENCNEINENCAGMEGADVEEAATTIGQELAS